MQYEKWLGYVVPTVLNDGIRLVCAFISAINRGVIRVGDKYVAPGVYSLFSFTAANYFRIALPSIRSLPRAFIYIFSFSLFICFIQYAAYIYIYWCMHCICVYIYVYYTLFLLFSFFFPFVFILIFLLFAVVASWINVCGNEKYSSVLSLSRGIDSMNSSTLSRLKYSILRQLSDISMSVTMWIISVRFVCVCFFFYFIFHFFRFIFTSFPKRLWWYFFFFQYIFFSFIYFYSFFFKFVLYFKFFNNKSHPHFEVARWDANDIVRDFFRD